MTGVGKMLCPDPSCRAPMVKRQNREHGGLFYGCSNYPTCSMTAPIPEREKLLALGCAELPGFETEGN